MMMMMMTTNTNSIIHVTKLMNNRKYTNTVTSFTSSNLLLNPLHMVHNNKSKSVFHPTILSNHHFNCKTKTHDSVFNSPDGNDEMTINLLIYAIFRIMVGYGSTESPIFPGKNIEAGDVLVGLLIGSSIHPDAFSLIKRVFKGSSSYMSDKLPGTNITLGESLWKLSTFPVDFVNQVFDIISQWEGDDKGIVYIGRGGFTDNIPRLFQSDLGAVIFDDSWPVPPVYKWIQEAGEVEDVEMRRTFGMGIGLVLVMSKKKARKVLRKYRGENLVYRIGKVVRGDGLRYRSKSLRRKAGT